MWGFNGAEQTSLSDLIWLPEAQMRPTGIPRSAHGPPHHRLHCAKEGPANQRLRHQHDAVAEGS